jgi:ketosteroid isomerase-like protein
MSPADQVRRIFAAFDAKDVSAFASFMTDDVRVRLGNAEPVEGKAAFVKGSQRIPRFGRALPSGDHQCLA